MSYEQTNKENLTALIDYVNSKQQAHNSIGYIAAGPVALLGKGHAQAVVSSFNPDDCYKGKISVSLLKEKNTIAELTFVIIGELHKGGKIVPQTGGRGELEAAIHAALPDALSEVPVKYQWSGN
ncbi:MAG: hypothetical protein BVN35_08150 [Proteobacteria bacterium ST_bin11]|nr:MAG: hypothetical protein BVN35_08150 [Proteobacteria bacterium ST_bin11]